MIEPTTPTPLFTGVCDLFPVLKVVQVITILTPKYPIPSIHLTSLQLNTRSYYLLGTFLTFLEHLISPG